MDQYLAEPTTIATEVKVQETWLSGKKVDLDSFMTQIQAVEAAANLVSYLPGTHRCSGVKFSTVAAPPCVSVR
jgi:hypothetical protein